MSAATSRFVGVRERIERPLETDNDQALGTHDQDLKSSLQSKDQSAFYSFDTTLDILG